MFIKESVILIVILVSVFPDGACGREAEDPGFHISTGCFINESELSKTVRSTYHLSQAKCTRNCRRYPGCERALYVRSHDYCHLYPCEVLDAFFIKNEESTFEESSTSEEMDFGSSSEESSSGSSSSGGKSSSGSSSSSGKSSSGSSSSGGKSSSGSSSSSGKSSSGSSSSSGKSSSGSSSSSGKSSSGSSSSSGKSGSGSSSSSGKSSSGSSGSSGESSSGSSSSSEESFRDTDPREESRFLSTEFLTKAEKCQGECARNPECITFSFDDLNIFCEPLCLLLSFDAGHLAECGKSSTQVVGVAKNRLKK